MNQDREEILFKYALWSLDYQNLDEYKDYLKNGSSFPWHEYGEYQNLLSLLPAALKISQPKPELKNKVAKRLYLASGKKPKKKTVLAQQPDIPEQVPRPEIIPNPEQEPEPDKTPEIEPEKRPEPEIPETIPEPETEPEKDPEPEKRNPEPAGEQYTLNQTAEHEPVDEPQYEDNKRGLVQNEIKGNGKLHDNKGLRYTVYSGIQDDDSGSKFNTQTDELSNIRETEENLESRMKLTEEFDDRPDSDDVESVYSYDEDADTDNFLEDTELDEEYYKSELDLDDDLLTDDGEDFNPEENFNPEEFMKEEGNKLNGEQLADTQEYEMVVPGRRSTGIVTKKLNEGNEEHIKYHSAAEDKFDPMYPSEKEVAKKKKERGFSYAGLIGIFLLFFVLVSWIIVTYLDVKQEVEMYKSRIEELNSEIKELRTQFENQREQLRQIQQSLPAESEGPAN